MKFLFAALLLVSSISLCQEEKKNPRLHTPAEIMKIMEESKIGYELTGTFDTEAARDTPVVLSNYYILRESEKGYTLEHMSISEKARPIYDAAEEAFQKREYEKACALFKQVREVQPELVHTLTLIGDCFFGAGQYDSAIVCFKQSIRENFVDYDAHWFLADTYDKCDLPDSALKEITIAHLLNVNHKNLTKALRFHRIKSGRPWDEWDFVPQYALSGGGDKVRIDCPPEWLGYALVKALWKYEPGYAESMTGKTDEKLVINWPEEKEAVVAMLADSSRGERLTKIIEEGYFNEFALYEMAAKKNPSVMMLLPREMFYRVAEYVDKFH